MTYAAKHSSEVKTARVDRKYVNAHKWHKITVKRFHKAERKAVKQALRSGV